MAEERNRVAEEGPVIEERPMPTETRRVTGRILMVEDSGGRWINILVVGGMTLIAVIFFVVYPFWGPQKGDDSKQANNETKAEKMEPPSPGTLLSPPADPSSDEKAGEPTSEKKQDPPAATPKETDASKKDGAPPSETPPHSGEAAPAKAETIAEERVALPVEHYERRVYKLRPNEWSEWIESEGYITTWDADPSIGLIECQYIFKNGKEYKETLSTEDRDELRRIQEAFLAPPADPDFKFRLKTRNGGTITVERYFPDKPLPPE